MSDQRPSLKPWTMTPSASPSHARRGEVLGATTWRQLTLVRSVLGSTNIELIIPSARELERNGPAEAFCGRCPERCFRGASQGLAEPHYCGSASLPSV